MKTIKLSKSAIMAANEKLQEQDREGAISALKVQNGGIYESRLKVDYGVPHMRMNVDVSNGNGALRTPLTQPKIKKRRKAYKDTLNNTTDVTYKQVSADHMKIYDSKNKEWGLL